MSSILALGMPGFNEWIVIALIGLLLFGKRLPEVGRSLGKGIVEFKRGLQGVEDEVGKAGEHPVAQQQALPAAPVAQPLPAAFKFDPYTGKPIEQAPQFDPYTGKPLEQATPTPAANATAPNSTQA